MSHEVGSLSWAAEYAKEHEVLVWLHEEKAAHWSPAAECLVFVGKAPHYVTACTNNLTGWTIEAPAPEPTAKFFKCPQCNCAQLSGNISCAHCGYNWHVPEPQTEDVPIEDFIVCSRRAQASGYEAETKFKHTIKCHLYPDGKGGFEEFCTDRAWKEHGELGLFTCPPDHLEGGWTQATHVRLRKE